MTINGVDVHPGFAKGKLVNAMRLASRVIAALPVDTLAPEMTSGRQGFIHPYALDGSPARGPAPRSSSATSTTHCSTRTSRCSSVAQRVVDAEPRATLEIEVREQYRNMRRYLDAQPRVARPRWRQCSPRALSRASNRSAAGTDGSQLSARGLPTPNIFDGGHEYHSVREWASLQEMAASAATLVRLCEIWAAAAP